MIFQKYPLDLVINVLTLKMQNFIADDILKFLNFFIFQRREGLQTKMLQFYMLFDKHPTLFSPGPSCSKRH